MNCQKKLIHIFLDFFAVDNGSLPDISISNLDKEVSYKIFKNLLTNSEKLNDDVTVWDESIKKERICNKFEDLNTLYEKVVANSSVLPLVGLKFNDATLPELGLFVSESYMEIDYRMGEAWTENNVYAFLELLKNIHTDFPTVNIEMSKDGEATFSDKDLELFNRMLKEYFEL